MARALYNLSATQLSRERGDGLFNIDFAAIYSLGLEEVWKFLENVLADHDFAPSPLSPAGAHANRPPLPAGRQSETTFARTLEVRGQ